jgi:hypothetical protein
MDCEIIRKNDVYLRDLEQECHKIILTKLYATLNCEKKKRTESKKKILNTESR